jgi:acetoin utilization protein AcuB
MMGLLTASSRIDLVIGDEPGAFRNVLQIINDNGGDIINVGITGKEIRKRVYYFRLSACNTAVIKKALEKEGYKVLDAMD